MLSSVLYLKIEGILALIPELQELAKNIKSGENRDGFRKVILSEPQKYDDGVVITTILLGVFFRSEEWTEEKR